MKRLWTTEELEEYWTLLPEELALLTNKSGHTRRRPLLTSCYLPYHLEPELPGMCPSSHFPLLLP